MEDDRLKAGGRSGKDNESTSAAGKGNETRNGEMFFFCAWKAKAKLEQAQNDDQPQGI